MANYSILQADLDIRPIKDIHQVLQLVRATLTWTFCRFEEKL